MQLVHRSCVFWMRGRRDDADEAHSRTAVIAFQKWPADIVDSDHAKAWLLTVARNACVDLFRERRSRREISLDTEVGNLEEESVLGSVGLTAGPEDSYFAREQRLRLLACLRQLPFRLRRPAELYFVHEFPYRDVARHLEISEVSVRKRIQQARDVLRRAVAGPPHEAAPPEKEEEPGEAARLSLFAAVVETDDGIVRDAATALPLRRPATARQMAALQQYTRTHPRGWRKRFELGRALVSVGAWREAVPHYRYALAKQPFPVQPWLELGAILTALGRGNEAAAVYAEGATRTSRDADRAQLRARADAMSGEGVRALAAIRHSVTVPGDDAAAVARQLRAYGELALAQGRPLEAAVALERCLEADAADPLARVLCHDALLAAGRPIAAREQLVEAFARGDASAPVLERLIADRCRARAIDDDAVGRLLAALRQAAPQRAATHAAAALLLLANGRGQEAESFMTGFVAEHRKHPGGWLWLACIRGAVGGARAAVLAASSSLCLDETDREAWLAAGRLVRQAAAAISARRLSRRIGKLFPGDPPLLAEAGLLASVAGDPRETSAFCAAARRLDPALPRLHFAHAEVLASAGSDREAVMALLEGWELLPVSDGHQEAAQAALLLARCHVRLGEPLEARAWLRVALLRAVTLEDVDPPLSFFLRGQALAAIGSHAEALAAYRQAAARHLVHPWRAAMAESVRRIVVGNSQTPSGFRSLH